MFANAFLHDGSIPRNTDTSFAVRERYQVENLELETPSG
jgi:hypothetical protein